MARHTSVRVGRPPVVDGPLTLSQYNQAMTRRLVFGHQSVGWQVITGIGELADSVGGTGPTVLDVTTETIPGTGGFVGHFYCGTNGDSTTKTAHFDSLLRGGLADDVDTAVLKFCYADLRSTSGYTPAQMFADYAAVMDDLVVDFPAVKFIFATETIVMEVDEDGPNNTLRMAFNNAVRAAYASTGRLWDIALAESTTPTGTRIRTGSEGSWVEHLFADYASADQEHISGVDGIGRMAAAKPLVQLMARL